MADIEREREWMRRMSEAAVVKRDVENAVYETALIVEASRPCSECGHDPHPGKFGGLWPCMTAACDCGHPCCDCGALLAEVGGYPSGGYACPSCERQWNRVWAFAAVG